MIAKVLELLRWRCAHQHVAFPMHGQQVCMQCSARRSYQIGGPFGPWHYERPESKEVA